MLKAAIFLVIIHLQKYPRVYIVSRGDAKTVPWLIYFAIKYPPDTPVYLFVGKIVYGG